MTQIVQFKNIKIYNGDDIKTLLSNNDELSKYVQENQSSYTTISIPDIMEKLMIGGDLLKVSIAASYGFPCNKNILAITLDYQSFIKESYKSCSVFVMKSIEAIQLIKDGLDEAENDLDYSIDLIMTTCEMANEMEQIANQMSHLAGNLVKKSTEALLSANDNREDVLNEEKEKKLESEIGSIGSSINEFHNKANQAAEEAERERNSLLNYIKVVVKAIVPWGHGDEGSKNNGGIFPNDPTCENKKSERDNKKNELKSKKERLENMGNDPNSKVEKEKIKEEIETIKKEIKDLNESIKQLEDSGAKLRQAISSNGDKETQFLMMKAHYQDLQRKSKSELAGKVQMLESLVEQSNDLQVSVTCLDITVKTLGHIKTNFDNTSVFWSQVKNQCEKLFNKKRIELALKTENMETKKRRFIEQVSKSGLDWLSIAHMNFNALDSMKLVDNGIDNIISNLPTREESKIMVKECCKKLLSNKLENDDQQ
ncbi:hypothetical protein ACTA71_010965 [Dictyostelium dimigraforme]